MEICFIRRECPDFFIILDKYVGYYNNDNVPSVVGGLIGTTSQQLQNSFVIEKEFAKTKNC
jgi:hypothetical protein